MFGFLDVQLLGGDDCELRQPCKGLKDGDTGLGVGDEEGDGAVNEDDSRIEGVVFHISPFSFASHSGIKRE